MNYFQLFRANPGILSFGVLLVFFSSLGQTFVVALYIPDFMENFSLSSSAFSSLYALATLLSATTLIFVGKKIDHLPLKHFVLFVVTGIFLACLLTAIAWHVVVLFFGVYALRLFGQGLLMHTSMTTLARYFTLARGKALSIASMGFPLGEAIFPVAVASSIGWLGWRETLVVSAAIVLVVLFPFSLRTLGKLKTIKVVEGRREPMGDGAQTEADEGRIWKQREVVRTAWFYTFAPTVFLVGFIQTALFFFQTFIAAEKGWSIEWMAGSIVAYATSSIFMSLVGGQLVDKYSARRIFPYMLIPLAMGLVVLSLGDQLYIAPLFWLLVGFTGGLNSPVGTSLYAETFGTRSMGAVRSMFTFVMVVSTALGPVVYSFFLERDSSFDQIHYGLVGVVIVNMLYILSRSVKKQGSEH